MAKNTKAETHQLKKELRACKSKLKEAESFNERLRAAIGYDELKGWKPQQRIESQYGWIYAWLYPLYGLIDSQIDKPISPDMRNKIVETTTAIIAQMAVKGKYGVLLPFDPKPVDMANYEAKQSKTFNKIYDPCAICGEKRITHECHIIPHSEGGTLHRDNFVILCPLHHHLFDHSRLSESEWEALETDLDRKMEAARIYANQVRLPQLQVFWRESESKSKQDIKGI